MPANSENYFLMIQAADLFPKREIGTRDAPKSQKDSFWSCLYKLTEIPELAGAKSLCVTPRVAADPWRLNQRAPAQNDKSAFRRGGILGGKDVPVCRSGFPKISDRLTKLCTFPWGKVARRPASRMREGPAPLKGYAGKRRNCNTFSNSFIGKYRKNGMNIP